jgi:hypothetical protein
VHPLTGARGALAGLVLLLALLLLLLRARRQRD